MKKTLATLALLLITSLSANAAIKVSPGYVELDANKSKKDYITGSFTIAGGKDETVRFKVYPEFFEHDTNGKFVDLPDNGQKNSLMGKMKFFPSEFTCQNGQEQKVRFTITDLKSLPAGESRLVLFLEDADTKEVLIKKANGGIGGKILVKTRVGVPIYLDKGMYTKHGNLDTLAVKVKGSDCICDYKIVSSGNSKIRYNGTAYLSQGDKLVKTYDIHGTTVQGGKFLQTAQTFELPKEDVKAGEEYQVKFVLRYQDEKKHDKTMKKEVSFIADKSAPSKI